MTPYSRDINEVYQRAGMAAVLRSQSDTADMVTHETEKVVSGFVAGPFSRLAKAFVTAWLFAGLMFGIGAAAYTEAAWSDVRVVDANFLGAADWTIEVAIRVHPTVNSGSGGRTPVTIYGSADFDPALLDVSTLCFGSPTNWAARTCDVLDSNGPNGPGFKKVMVKFKTDETGIQVGDTVAILRGKTVDGMEIYGVDAISTAPASSALASAPMLQLAPDPKPSGADAVLLAPPPDAEPATVPTLTEPDPVPSGVEATPPAPAPKPEPEGTVDPVDSPPKTEAPPIVDAGPVPVGNTDTPPAPIELEPTEIPAEQPPPPPESPVPAEVDEPKVDEPKVDELKVEEPKPEPTAEGGDATPGVDETPTETISEPPILVPDLVDLNVRKATRAVLVTAGVPDQTFEPAIDSVETAADAAALLNELCRDLLCGGVVFEERETDRAVPGTILEQSRAADAEWNADDRLTLVVAVAPPPPPRQTEPDQPSDAGDSPPDEPPPSEDTVAKTADAEAEAIATEPTDSVTEEPADDAAAADGGQP